jgi:hypothetical protein
MVAPARSSPRQWNHSDGSAARAVSDERLVSLHFLGSLEWCARDKNFLNCRHVENEAGGEQLAGRWSSLGSITGRKIANPHMDA